jgi:hypothetical protein
LPQAHARLVRVGSNVTMVSGPMDAALPSSVSKYS